MTVVQLALIFFIVTNPVGNSPTILALIKNHSLREQQKIMFRESIFSMLLALFFLFVGESFLNHLNIQDYSLNTSGGILLFVVALHMIFSDRSEKAMQQPAQTPFIVPIATPLISGAGLLTMIMLYAKEESTLTLISAIFIAWVGITAVLVSAPYLQILIGKRGLLALEQLMGMLLSMIAVEMIVNGMALFMKKI